MRFRSSLLDEKSTQIQVALLARQTIKADQSQLNFRMSAIARQLMRSGTKYRRQVIRQTKGNIEQSLFTGGLLMDHGSLDQVTRAVELMQVAKIFEAVPWAPGQDVAIQVAVRLLSAREEVNRSVDQCFEFRIFMMLQIGARRLEPFRHVRVPEDAASPVPGARLLPSAVHALIESQGI